MWTEQSKKNFDTAMEQERYYMAQEYAAAEKRDYEEADFCHRMRWQMMDKAVSLLRPCEPPCNHVFSKQSGCCLRCDQPEGPEQ